MRIQCLTHVSFENAALIQTWADLRGHALTYTHLYNNDPLPEMNAFDFLAAMGGPMNIYEHDLYPWLIAEKEFIHKAIKAGKKVLGVCLGSQLIADVLGGKVTQNTYKEIGWFDIRLTPAGRKHGLFHDFPDSFPVFHWHGDTFSIPPGATPMASSTACENQAFIYRPGVLGLQFHMEYSEQSILAMLDHCKEELIGAPYIQTTDRIKQGLKNLPTLQNRLFSLLDRL